MVATRATRQEHLPAASTSVSHRLVDLTAADMEPLADPNDALEDDSIPVDVEMDALDDALKDVDNKFAKSARGPNCPASSPARVPLHPATSARTATPRSFAPIPRVSSSSARAGKTPTRILSRQTADPILPEDPKNFLKASGRSSVSDGRGPRPKSVLPEYPKNPLEDSGSAFMSEGRGRTSEDILTENFEAGPASPNWPHSSQESLSGSPTNTLIQSEVVDVGPSVPDSTSNSRLHSALYPHGDGDRSSAPGDGQNAIAGHPTPFSNGPRAAPSAVPADDVWAFQAQQRAKTSKAKSKDIGEHRPTMDELAPLLEKHAAGQLTFNDTLPIQKHSTRDVVGWLHMATGSFTKDIDVDTAMASLLFGNRDLGIDTALADIVKCEKDVSNRLIKWGIASDAALQKLRGVTMQIQVARNGTKQGFSMTSPHVLDGFYLDIPQGLHGVAEERLLFDVMSRLEPRFLWGTYTSVSATTGLASSRYRLHFLGNAIPPSLHRDGRMVEEFVFLGRRLRVYGQGWFFRDKQLARIDLDGLALAHGLYGNTASRQDRHDSLTDPKPTKKAKVAHTPEPQWKTVKQVRSKSNSTRRPGWMKPSPGRPWVSDNMFAALDERISVSPVVSDCTYGSTTVTVYSPKTTVHDTACEFKTADEFMSGTKVESSRPVRVECSLDAILDELKVLDAQSNEASHHLPAQVEEACKWSSFNLATLVADGRVDTICSCLERSPTDFGIQLHRLFKDDRQVFEYFVRQRLLHRWFRATWGGSKSFDQLYKAAFGQSISAGHTVALFSNPDFAAATKPMVVADANGDDRELHWTDIEAVLALTEVLLAARATIYFNSDAAICASTKCPVTAIASHKGSRCLSSETVGALLMDTDLGTLIWDTMEDMYSGNDDDDVGMRLTMSTILEFHQQGCLDVTATNQVMLDPVSKCLTFGDVTDPVTSHSG
ncbi:hypothetical protein DYB32_003304 [Aphanomyces invadans]|uniref:Uncharacterized protein n=1 Tax=Aphanomyces invadans TaxID=157072 RepID=A0A418B1D1_9STRA|nr:hypothetical protein DYB32_003304 [Aphanomyces invadans]